MHIPPLEPDPVNCSNDHDRGDTEDFEGRPVGVPPLEVGHGDSAFGGIERRPEARVEIGIGEEGETPGRIVPSNQAVITSHPRLYGLSSRCEWGTSQEYTHRIRPPV